MMSVRSGESFCDSGRLIPGALRVGGRNPLVVSPAQTDFYVYQLEPWPIRGHVGRCEIRSQD